MVEQPHAQLLQSVVQGVDHLIACQACLSRSDHDTCRLFW